MKEIKTPLATLTLGLLLFSNFSYGQAAEESVNGQSSQQSKQFESEGKDIYKSKTIEEVGSRSKVQYEQPNARAQLQQAKQNVQVDKQNIQKAEEKKKDDEAQVDIDEATIKKYEAQLEEDEAHVKKLEESLKSKK